LVDIHVSEREQVEALKRWWQQNGMAVVTGVVLGVAALVGWHYWKAWQGARAENASVGFQDLVSSHLQDNDERAIGVGRTLLQEHGDSGYATLAALTMARIEVERGRTEEARAHLQWAIANGEPAAAVDVARLRLARLLLAAGEADAAGEQLQATSTLSEEPLYHELRGEVLAARGDVEQARSALRRAIELASAHQLDTTVLELELDELGAPATTAPAGR